MRFLSLREPLTRRQCVHLLLALTFSWWVFGVYSYVNLRQSEWQLVQAKIVKIDRDSQRSTQILLYELDGEPHVASVDLAASGFADSFGSIDQMISVLVSRSNPNEPIIDFNDLSRRRITNGLFLLISSTIALYISLRLVRTLDAEIPLRRNTNGMQHLIDEFAAPSGWSEGFQEMIERREQQEGSSRARASGGSGTNVV